MRRLAIGPGLAFFFCFLFTFPAATSPLFRALPVYFEANLGQGPPGAGFLARGGDYQLALMPTGSVLTVQNRERHASASVETLLVDADRRATLEGLDPLDARVHWLNGAHASLWGASIPLFGRVRAKD